MLGGDCTSFSAPRDRPAEHQPVNPQLLRHVSYITAHLTVLVVTAVLIGAFVVQFAAGEFPCPLCILQRMAMMLAALGPAWMIAVGHRHSRVDPRDFTCAFGMTVLGAILGSAISIRQILLHIQPGDVGYGSPVFGLHLYTWALLVFVALLVDAGIHLIFIRQDVPITPKHPSILSKWVLWLFWIVILINAIAVFAEAGWNPFLSDNPTAYLLFG
jgi:disulfide bond formation protein DsbB